MDRGKADEARKALLVTLENGDLHLHYYSSPGYWMIVEKVTARCGTSRCFRLRIKNFHPKAGGGPPSRKNHLLDRASSRSERATSPRNPALDPD